MSTLVPELDASAQRFNIRMFEGDAINFDWIVPTFSGWAGTYAFRVLLPDGTVQILANTVVAQGADARFHVVDTPKTSLTVSRSGHPWEMEDTVNKETRFAGLLFVDEAIVP